MTTLGAASTRRRSLRNRLFGSAIAVALSPFIFLVSMSRWEIHQAQLAEDDAARTVEAVAAQLAQTDDVAALVKGEAVRFHQRVRVVRDDGVVLLDVDGSSERDTAILTSDFFYGPVTPPLETMESEDGPLRQRVEFTAGQTTRFAPGGNLQVHAVTRRVEQKNVWVHVRAHSRRAVLPDIARSRQIAKLLSVAIAVALLVAWLAARRLFDPLEKLRVQLLELASTAVPRSGVNLGRRDELGDLADAFNTVLTALSERTRTNEEFLTDLAHELKNPVAAVRTCSELLSKGGVDAERAQRLTEVLQQSSHQLDRLVTQFLELARAEAGLPSEGRESFSLTALLQGLQSRLAPDPRFAHVTWKTVGFELPAQVQGVATRLERAFQNLLLNALTFAGNPGWVEVRVQAISQDQIEVRITDSGPGIEAEQLPRLFERFHTTRQESSGTGLGLALTRAIIEAHGGRITAESPERQGACFAVRLPLERFT